MKKYLAECLGTMVLVLMGCGAAVSLGCSVDNAASVVGTSFAFGLAVVAMAYAIGGISGCHINPAITLGVWLSKRMSGKEINRRAAESLIKCGAFDSFGLNRREMMENYDRIYSNMQAYTLKNME